MAMMTSCVLPLLHQQFPSRPKQHSFFFRLFGLPESHVNARVSGIPLPENVELSYRAHFPEVHVTLKSWSPLPPELATAIGTAIGERHIITTDPNEALTEVVVRLLGLRNAVVATAESCTGGLLGALLTEVPGASEIYAGGAVCYANELKTELAGIDPSLIEKHGAVSEEVSIELANYAASLAAKSVEEKKRYSGSHSQSSSYGISITGIAGPEGGSPGKPVGTFFVGITTPNGTESKRVLFPSSRDRIRLFAAYTALDWLRTILLEETAR
jgi:nicotinamide-nucleotide amidase